MIKRLRTLIKINRLDLESGMFYLHQLAKPIISRLTNGIYMVKAAGKWAVGRTLFEAVQSLLCHMIVCL